MNEIVAQWGDLALAAIGTFLAFAAFILNRRTRHRARRIESERSLAKAYDLLAQRQGATWLFEFKNTAEGLEQARRLIQEALSQDDKNPRAHMYLGLYWQFRKESEKAIECHNRAITLDPSFASAYNNLGRTLKEAGDLQGAIENYRLALSLDNKFNYARNNLGVALAELGKLEEATSELEIVARDPYCPSVILDQLSVCYLALKKHEKASEYKSKAAARRDEETRTRASSP